MYTRVCFSKRWRHVNVSAFERFHFQSHRIWKDSVDVNSRQRLVYFCKCWRDVDVTLTWRQSFVLKDSPSGLTWWPSPHWRPPQTRWPACPASHWLAHLAHTLPINLYLTVGYRHRKRINTGEKAKVIAAVWGTKLIQYFAALAVLLWTIWIIRMNCTRMIWNK